MARALIQCVNRTQAGWISGSAAPSDSIDAFVVASLVMAWPWSSESPQIAARGEPWCTGPRSATRRIMAAGDYFDIFSLDMLSFDMLSLDIWSFDRLSFFMLLSFDMLSLLISSAKAAGEPKAKASAIAATGSSKRERAIILVLHYVVMVSIPSLLIRTGG
jgi:hypothetical protein